MKQHENEPIELHKSYIFPRFIVVLSYSEETGYMLTIERIKWNDKIYDGQLTL